MFPSRGLCCDCPAGPGQLDEGPRHQGCAADGPDGPDERCSESEALRLFCQFGKEYGCRVAAVDADDSLSDGQRNELKLKIMTDWVKDLEEQNEVLVQTAHDLEQAAVQRVKLLEHKLQETSNLMSHSMSSSDKSEKDLNALSNRVCQLANNIETQDDLQKRIEFLQSDMKNLLCLIKRGLTENNWSLAGLRFYEIQCSDIPAPTNYPCSQITRNNNIEESAFLERDLEIETLREQLQAYKCNNKAKCKENDLLKGRLACTEEKINELDKSLTEEVAQKYDSIAILNEKIQQLECDLKKAEETIEFKDNLICELRNNVKTTNTKAPNAARKVRITTEHCQKSEDKALEESICDSVKQFEELKYLIASKDEEIRKLKTKLSENSNEAVNSHDENFVHNTSTEYQNEIIEYLTNLMDTMKNEEETISSLRTEYEIVFKKLQETKNMYEKDMALVDERLQDIGLYLHDYRSQVIEQDQSKNIANEFITNIENQIVYIQKLFQNKCEICIKTNVLSELGEVISKVTSGISILLELNKNKAKTVSSIGTIIAKHNLNYKKNTTTECDQKAICAAFLQQFRMMEEYRICIVEVQAATEDLREEMSAVISNLNSRHCKYVELSKMVGQVQDQLTRTKENVSEVINRLELQDEERVRRSGRLTDNVIKLKDLKNEFNQTELELSKCLSNIHNNSQQNHLLGYAEVHTCNDLLVSLADEVDQIVSNLHIFETQGFCTLTTITELKKQLIAVEHSVKTLKKKSDQVLLESDSAQKLFTEKLKLFEKYQLEVDNCHDKMQDVLENICDTRNQMYEFVCINKTEDTFQCTNETVKLKEDVRKLQKECKELKSKIVQTSHVNTSDKVVSEWENRVIDLQDQINVLESEVKCKQEANTLLKQSLELLEKELNSFRLKAEDYRRCSSTECLELKKKIFELQNSLKLQKDTENDFKCLTNNETDSKKSEFLDYVNKGRLHDSSLSYGLQGTYENVPQLFRTLQDSVQTIKIGLQELDVELNRLVSEGSSFNHSYNKSVKAAADKLEKHIESIKHCSFEIEKIKVALYSKDKLMENMDEIIRIQKDSITISQSGAEDIHKMLQEKIDAQEREISLFEKEKRQLLKQVELQVQTIGHLQEAVVESKRTIDQLSNKAASDDSSKSQTIRSLNLYLTEIQCQYNDCFGEASEQGALLELQRDSISALQRRIKLLERDEFLTAFILHFIYYVILFKYQQELKSQNCQSADRLKKIDELLNQKNDFEKKYDCLQQKYEEAKNELKRLRCECQNSIKELSKENECRLEKLEHENKDLKKQIKTYKLDLDLIEDEMKKMGILNPSVENFKMKLSAMHLEKKKFRCDLECYNKMNSQLKYENKCLSLQFHDMKEKFHSEINSLNSQLNEAEKIIANLLKDIEEQSSKLLCSERCMESYLSERDTSNEIMLRVQSHNESLNLILAKKEEKLCKLEEENRILKQSNESLVAKNCMLIEKLKNETTSSQHQLNQMHCQLKESQEQCKSMSESMNKCLSVDPKSLNLMTDAQTVSKSDFCDCTQSSSRVEIQKYEIKVKKLTKDLEDVREKLSSKNADLSEALAKLNSLSIKYENLERNYRNQKDEMLLLEKRLGCQNQKLQICTDKNKDLLRQNTSLEDNNNKCMTELDDIVLQLEDMQRSLVDLRAECDAKAQSMERVSVELDKMRTSRSEMCEESEYVLRCVRYWMQEQRRTSDKLQEKLAERQQQLSRLGWEKKKFVMSMERLRRENRILTKKLKHFSKPCARLADVGCSCSLRVPKCSVKERNRLLSPGRRKSNAVYTIFKSECKEGLNYTVKPKGDSKWFPALAYLSKKVPKTPQVHGSSEDMADIGYQTSSSK